MKLTWRDAVILALVVFGGAVIYAKFNAIDWSFISGWRNAFAVLGLTGLAAAFFSNFDVADRSLPNTAEMIVGAGAFLALIWGIVIAAATPFYVLAAFACAAWLISIGRHLYHTFEMEHNRSRHLMHPRGVIRYA